VTDYERLFRLDGRRAVVVGAGAGIGRACADALAAFGADTMFADRDPAAAEEAAAAAGGRAFRLDVTSAEDIARAAAELEPADVLVIAPGFNVRRPLIETSDEDFDRVVDVNLKGPYRLMKAFGGGMAERGRGSIVLFSSFRAVVVEPGQGLYAACKAGIVQMGRAFADELGTRGVRVNAIAPGPTETPLTQQIKADPQWWDAYRDKTIVRRWAQPSEIAGAVVYLASDASSFTTGALYMVDGGWTAADGRFRPAGSP
jgi:NAD(P)-dependent dehydrogenase (short-subunit alcohol dehydrogenase family)